MIAMATEIERVGIELKDLTINEIKRIGAGTALLLKSISNNNSTINEFREKPEII